MRIFLTGATGFIGSAIIPELLAAGHQVLGLTRSQAGAEALRAAGAGVHMGNLEDLESLRQGATATDGIIHCGFNHDFSKFMENCENDRRSIAAMGAILAGSSRPFLITSGVGMGASTPGQPATEDHFDAANPHPRRASEDAAAALLDRGVNVSILRLPQVHDTHKQGLITPVIEMTRAQGVSAYVGEGANRWAAVHVLDAARLYRLAFERQLAGSRYHAVAEEGVPARQIAEVIGRRLNLPVVTLTPEQAPAHFGWMAGIAAMDLSASSAITRQKLDWHPTGPGLIADLEAMDYTASS